MLGGKYGLDAAAFRVPIHPVTLLLIAALAVAWNTDGRKNAGVALSGYAGILVVTGTYFVPELLAFTGTPFSETADPALAGWANRWELLSLVS